MTDGRESANADTEKIHAEDSPASSPKSLNNNENNNNDKDNSIQPQSNQKEENDDNPEEENLLSSSKGNSDNSNQNNLSENSQENTDDNSEGRKSANSDTKSIHAEDSPASSPKSLNNNDKDTSIQSQSNQKEENAENPEEENLLSSSKGNSDNSNQNNLSENSQENTEENTQNKNESQPLEQNTPNSEKNNEIEKQEEQTKSDNVPENNQIENQPPIPISSIIQPTDINEQVEVVLNVFAKATDENNQNDNENDQSQNTKTNSNNEAQNFLRSFSTNVITNQNNNGQPIFHRQISITNSNLPSNEANASPIQQHLSVPLMPLYTNSSTPNNNNSNSLLSFQFLYQQQQLNSKPIVPVIAPNSLFPTSNQNHKLSTSPNAASVIQTQPHKHHHHHHHHHRKQQQEEDEPQETEQQEQTRSPLGISPSDLQEILSREDDEPELDLPPQTSAALENFKKTGKLHFNLPSSRTARSAPTADTNNAVNNNTVNNGNESVSYSPTIIRKLQRDKVNAIIKGRYDEAKEADSLSKRVTTAVIESVEEEKRYERLRQAEWKLEDEKRIFVDVHKECIEKVKEEEEALNKRMISLDEIHIAEQKQFEDKWNNEDFLRRFSKPSSSLLQLKAVERSMAIAKMFDEAKVVKSRAEQLEKVETKEKQNRAEQEMKVERSRLLERQKKEKQGLKEKCDNLLVIAKRNMEKEEAPYKQRISRLEAIVAELKSGNESKCKIVPSKVQSSLISPRGSGNELLTARTAFKFSAYKVTAQSMKLKIKPLGCVTIQEKKKSKTSKK